jgi:hypothetical protein
MGGGRMSGQDPNELTPDERRELERLRRESVSWSRPPRRTRWAHGGRWVGAVAVLLVAAVLGSLAVVAVYLRSEVLDTDTYVETVAPLGSDPTVRTAVAARLTDELVARSDLEGLTNELAEKLVSEGAPARTTDLVGPLVGGISSFVNGKINELMATQRFEEAWQNINRVGHQGLVTALTGGQGKVVTSEGYTVTVDLGALLSMAKEELVKQGFTIVEKVPDVSIPYTLVESTELPKIRTYTRLLNTVGSWLPWVALVLFLGGVLIAPNHRRGLLLGALLTGALAALVLGGVTFARTYYVDNLPPEIKSPEAASVVITTVLRYLVAALQTLVVAMLVLVLGAILAGPSRAAVWFRTGLNRVLDLLARLLRRTGGWAVRTGRALAAAVRPLQILIGLGAAAVLVAANRPGIPAVLWTTGVVLLVFAVLEVFVRTERVGPPRAGPQTVHNGQG